MANEKNLKPNSERTPEERKELARKAGKASGEARRRNKTFREVYEALLADVYKDANGNERNGTELLAMRQFEKAAKGDTKAYDLICKATGQNPIEQLQVGVSVSGNMVQDLIGAIVGGEDNEQKG